MDTHDPRVNEIMSDKMNADMKTFSRDLEIIKQLNQKTIQLGKDIKAQKE